jgi:tRNA threonylcarbamoyl adenosine modification protein (Sua5/YciO/YrdC/YwlC family)
MPWDGTDSRVLEQALAVLRRGALLVLPTDTVYGVAADPCEPGAEQRLNQAKGRGAAKPIPLLAADCAQIEGWPVSFTPLARLLARRYWPGALTMVLAAGAGRWEGFRIPNHAPALALLRAAGRPLRVTSANRSGAPPALTAAAAADALGATVDLVLDAGPAPGGRPSTVVKVENENLTVLREGAIPGRELIETWRGGGRGQY